MKAVLILFLSLISSLAAQDSKPAKTEKPASAPTTRPYDAKILNRKVSLSLPGDWVETDKRSTFALDGWEHGKSWKHPKIAGFSVHLYGVEGKDLTPAILAKRWLDSAGGAKIDLEVEVTGKSRQMKGLDVEIEIDENGSPSFYWMRAIGGAKDRVFVIIAEASPLNYESLERIVLAAGPILDSFLDPAKKDPWKRDPDVTVTTGPLVTRLTVPAGWKYTRLAPEGSLIWMGPEDMQEFVLAFPQRSMNRTPFGRGPDMSPDQLFEMTVKTAEMMGRMTGKLVSKGPLAGPEKIEELITMARGIKRLGQPPLWERRRVILHEKTVISIAAKQPLKDYDVPPPDPVQKQVNAVFDSLKFEAAK